MLLVIWLLVGMMAEDIDASIAAYASQSGGKRQRLAVFGRPVDPGTCQTEDYLLEEYALHGLPAIKVKQVTSKFCADHTGVRSEVRRLGTLGGNHPGNTARALRTVAKKVPIADIDEVTVPIFDVSMKPSPEVRMYQHRMINPDDYANWAWIQHPRAFETFVKGDRTKPEIIQFWHGMSREDCSWRHYRLNDLLDDELGQCIPILTYGDAVPIVKHSEDSMACISVKSMIAKGSPIDQHMLLSALPTKIIYKDRPRHNVSSLPIHSRISHRLEALASGYRFANDEMGNPLEYDDDEICGGNRLLCIRQASDLEWFENELELRHHASLHPCQKCNCTLRGNFTDFSVDAAWKGTIFDHTSWQPAHVSFRHMGHDIGPEYASIDFAHSSDKGFSGLFIGSVLYELVHEKKLDPAKPTFDGQIVELNARLKAYRNLHKNMSVASYIKRKDFENVGDFPEYKPGNMAKTRGTVPFIAQLCHEFNEGTPRDVQRKWASHCLSQLYEVIYTSGDHISGPVAVNFRASCDAYLLHYNWLASHYEDQDMLLYKVVLKQHYLFHIVYEACWTHLNPKLTMTLTGEDLVGKVATISRACTKSTPVTRLGGVVLEKYALGMAIRWKNLK